MWYSIFKMLYLYYNIKNDSLLGRFFQKVEKNWHLISGAISLKIRAYFFVWLYLISMSFALHLILFNISSKHSFISLGVSGNGDDNDWLLNNGIPTILFSVPIFSI